jgi:hypothetical protein
MKHAQPMRRCEALTRIEKLPPQEPLFIDMLDRVAVSTSHAGAAGQAIGDKRGTAQRRAQDIGTH